MHTGNIVLSKPGDMGKSSHSFKHNYDDIMSGRSQDQFMAVFRLLFFLLMFALLVLYCVLAG